MSDQNDSLNIILRDPDNKKLVEKNNVHVFKDSFTTFGGGYYEICMINTLSQEVKVDFDCKHGIAAKDYSQVPKVKDLEPIEQDLQKLEDMSKELYHLIMYSDSHEKTYGSLQDGVIMGISWVSIILIIIMLVVGGVEVVVGKKIVMSRKLK
eukprot:CAMPEP_0170515398 /NCGR_PEP_ID=MMETSP0209-20121228/1836_1 /TAXON_ID=665100 ORGANISM="Litonotus pictus, Strain P1" /NCGR_SAMPLE_ID=MMETSP0209 /ASSEMBLY_ACC=CAM_ASM_000301 /LENGTH=151 /DNA_ID=CAMNT_0010799867 /DNA_START=152 /DNA_END=607 /DNA_ORIENTATION=+